VGKKMKPMIVRNVPGLADEIALKRRSLRFE
jgi:hypothetical protein